MEGGPVVVGVDLALVRPSAVAIFSGCVPLCYGLAMEDGEIARLALALRPRAVAIDAPLTPGPREVEPLLRRRGYRLLPPNLGPMRRLTERGIRLASMMVGADVVEVHPLTSARAMGIDLARLGGLLGIRHRDLLDAAVAALTALAYLEGVADRIGPFVLPRRLPTSCSGLIAYKPRRPSTT